ncbi:hypothetical protein FISHEDRAFT_38006 [Fistulina hepatica ATCC 64428]|nr:hypothetical protein FISHEDRAFT_38006 [Fistulina hepatica ATCC 64428]
MSSLLTSAGKKLFAQHVGQYAPEDPMYETYVDKKGRTKRKRREIPPGLPKRDAKILKSVQRRAHYLDKSFSICGLRFGYTFIIGLIPVAGDVAVIALNYLLVVRKARKANIPSWLLRRMLLNNCVSAAVGFIPVLGDIILAVYKANSRNAALLEEFLRIRGEEFIRLEKEGVPPQSGSQLKKDAHGVAKDGKQVRTGTGIEGGEQTAVKASGTMPSAGPSKRKSSLFGFSKQNKKGTFTEGA